MSTRDLWLTIAVLATAHANLYGHASGGGHVHSTSMGDSGSGFGSGGGFGGGFGGGGFGGGPQMPGGGYMPPMAPPPPPPAPPKLSTPKTIPGTGEGAVSKVRELGEPGVTRRQPASQAERRSRAITGIYSDGSTESEPLRETTIGMPAFQFVDLE